MGTHATKVAKNLSNKYSPKLFDSFKKSTADAIKTTSKTVIQTAEWTDDLIADKVTKVSKNSSKELHSQSNLEEAKKKHKYQKKDISFRKKTTDYWYIKISIIS